MWLELEAANKRKACLTYRQLQREFARIMEHIVTHVTRARVGILRRVEFAVRRHDMNAVRYCIGSARLAHAHAHHARWTREAQLRNCDRREFATVHLEQH